MMTTKDRWVVEVFKNLSYKHRRVFRSRDDAVSYINAMQDRLHDDGKDRYGLRLPDGPHGHGRTDRHERHEPLKTKEEETTMARRWRNFTDLNDTELKRLYTQMLPPGLKAHDVEIKNHGAGGGRGTAYYAGSAYHTTARPFVVVSVPKTDKASRVRRKAHDGYLPVDTGSRMEVFVYILAHELRHLWQAKSKGRPRGMVYGAKGRFSERDACAYGMQMLRRYRRGEL